jgi:pimeloyl-ACP methyl ester carboxylesterase
MKGLLADSRTVALLALLSASLPAPTAGGDPPEPPDAAAASPRPTVFLIGDSTVKDGRGDGAGGLFNRFRESSLGAQASRVIDLDEIAARRYEAAGAGTVGREYFTAADHTHTTRAGAAIDAGCVVEGLRGLADHPLRRFLAVTDPAGSPRTEDVKFIARCDGSEQAYVVVYPDGFEEDRPHDVLVALHGHGSDRWQYVNDPRDECRTARETASARRMLFVSPDYRARTSWMGPKAEEDLLQIIDEMKSRHRIGKLILCGGSMGGSSALTFAALHPDRVQGVVSMNGTANHLEYENFQDAIRESFGGAKEAIPLEYKKRSAEYWPERLTMPVAITAGGRDEAVPPGSVVRLAAVLKRLGRDVLLIYRESEGHRTGYEDGKRSFEFVIEKALGAPESGEKGSGGAQSHQR